MSTDKVTTVANGHVISAAVDELERVLCAACGDVLKDRRGSLPVPRRCPGASMALTSPPEPGDDKCSACNGTGRIKQELDPGIWIMESCPCKRDVRPPPRAWVPLRPDALVFDDDAGGLHPASPSSIALRSSVPGAARDVLSFHADGTIKVGEGVTADEAAAAVVEALRPRFAEMIRQERARYPLRVVTADPPSESDPTDVPSASTPDPTDGRAFAWRGDVSALATDILGALRYDEIAKLAEELCGDQGLGFRGSLGRARGLLPSS